MTALSNAITMPYRNLGRSGLKVSALSYGSWLTFGDQVKVADAKNLMKFAYDSGVNFFDNAEVYGQGESERVMGKALKDFNRSSLVISTKIFWGGDGPNDTGLSWKHLVEGTKASLKRLDLEYVDLLFCHRPDPTTPIAETVRAMDFLVRQGYAFYWGTSEWSAPDIEEAFRLAAAYNCIPPTMEQPQYNLLIRDRVEKEYSDIFKKHGLGTTIWSPLASGVLTGKYLNGMPDGSRLAQNDWLRDRFTAEVAKKVTKLQGLATELDTSLAKLSIAWCLTNPNVSTVILGATGIEQLRENLSALEVVDRLTPAVLTKLDGILR